MSQPHNNLRRQRENKKHSWATLIAPNKEGRMGTGRILGVQKAFGSLE